MSATHYHVFGRNVNDDDDEYAPWWPLYATEGPVEAANASEAMAEVRGLLAANNEDDWRELAATPAAEFVREKP